MPLSPITPIHQPCFLSITVDITFVGLLLGPFVWLVLVAQAIVCTVEQLLESGLSCVHCASCAC